MFLLKPSQQYYCGCRNNVIGGIATTRLRHHQTYSVCSWIRLQTRHETIAQSVLCRRSLFWALL